MRDLYPLFAGIVVIMVCAFGLGVAIDYWNGTARAAIIKKQTGEEYTWREAAQIKNMFDRNNVKITFDNDSK